MKIIIVILCFSLFLSGCGLFRSNKDDLKTYIIVDSASNKVINTYQYDNGNTLLRTESFDSSENVTRIINYEYDSRGNLISTEETMPGGKQVRTDYTTSEEFDKKGRLLRSYQSSSDGTQTETLYGYDKDGKLKAVQESINGDTVIIRAYGN